jgi:Zn-dependent peptidase ImmA (M78 family)/DNA-binding XRE family transcriptional regulator
MISFAMLGLRGGATMNELSVNLMRYRKLSGLTQQALAEGAGISRVAYRNLEKGLSEPRESTLQSLAAALNVSLLDLFASVPKLKSLRFRANKMSEQERAECDQVVVRCAEWLQDFNELEALLNKQPQNQLKTIRKGSDPQKTAQAARRKLAQNCQCDCIEDICELLESAGIKVLLYPSKVKSFFGLSIGAADGGPAIAVNTAESISVERQIFSLAHELGHLILHKDSYGPDGVAEISDEAQEREADQFAAAFLMPSNLFDQVWKETRGLHWVDAVLKTKRHFNVSYQSVLHHLIDLGKAEHPAVYKQFRSDYEKRYGKNLHWKEEPRSLDPLDLMEDRLGILVRDALDAELITVGRAAEILNISIEEMRDQLRSWEVVAR